uniref:Uncharacterized protein n=1 Tax=Hucho hucho TaxID=62062 RepID=A0A4W5N0Q9_9TELE
VQALAGPLKDIQRLLRCLGCVLRVVVLLEGEPSPQSEVLSTLEQVFIKDLFVHLSLNPLKRGHRAGYKMVKQVLVNHAKEFGDRGIIHNSNSLFSTVILFANGDSWREMRCLGMCKKGALEKIIEEISCLVEVFKKHKNNTYLTQKPVNYAAFNIISAIVYGSRFEFSDTQFQGMVDSANESLRFTDKLYNMFPWLGLNQKDVKELVSGMMERLNLQVYRGFVPFCLFQESGNMDTHYQENNLISSVTNLFATVTLVFFPDLFQEEISRVIRSHHALVEDRKNMPYTDAVIHETKRLANIVPMSIPHTTSRDITFHGYFIRKVIVLLSYYYYYYYIFFNLAEVTLAGRRVCLGEKSLGRMELFLFFTSLLQRFCFSPPPGVTVDDLDLTPSLGFTLIPSPHQLCAV